jgi:hypothetical protein
MDVEDGQASLIRYIHELCSLELLSTGKSVMGSGGLKPNRKKKWI